MIPRLWSFRRKLSNTQLPRYFHSGVLNQHVKPNVPFYYSGVTKYGRKVEGRVVFRYSTMSEPTHESPPDIEILTFFKSTVDEHEGPNHCWLNKLEESKMHFGKDNLFLVLAGAFPRDSLGLGSNHILLFERVKYLQRRYPQLCVFGFQCDTSNCSISSQTHIVHAIMKEYLTFPILLTNKNFPVIKDEGCYLLFKDFKSPMLYYQEGTDIGTISRAIEELGLLKNENSEAVKELKVFGAKQLDLIKEPCVFPFQNFLLHYPGCISVDEDGNRLFLSDSNHHRIIIFDGNGKILDCIGSSPGFEDGEFESAKLLRPAASLYHAFEDCLYFVDSENHAIRRADIGGRTIETIYPPFRTGNNISGIWNWVLDKLGIGREVAPKSKELDLEPLLTPWHLMKSRENNLLIVSRSFHTLWIMDPASGRIEKVVTGYPKILEICGQMITEKVSLLKQISKEKFEQEVYSSTVEGFPIVSLVSSLVTFRNSIVFCDTVGQAVLKLNRESGIISNLHLSNFGILGLPHWLMSPLENIFVGGNTCQRVCPDHLQRFSVLPGRCNIQVNVDIPVDTELAGPLQEGCIWRQARGSAAEVSGFDDMDASSQEVGVAQQWFDELDNLAFETVGDDANGNPETNSQEENRLSIHSAINISPGTSEVIIYAALYLKMKKNSIYQEFCHEENVKRILDIVNHRSGKLGTDACAQLVVKSNRGIKDIVFMKPLRLRLEFDCQDHPKADKANEVVLTDSTIEVNVSLNKNHC